MAISTYIPSITSNVNGLMLQSKDTQWQIEWKDKQNQEPAICCLYETHFRVKDIHRPKGRDKK